MCGKYLLYVILLLILKQMRLSLFYFFKFHFLITVYLLKIKILRTIINKNLKYLHAFKFNVKSFQCRFYVIFVSSQNLFFSKLQTERNTFIFKF